MADNTQLPATGTGTADIVVATDKIGGVDYQRTKLVWGLDGTATDASATNPLPVTNATLDTEVGGLTETAPATDTASSGLNGRLQRIAQRLTSLIALLPAALGAGGGLKVQFPAVSWGSEFTTAVTGWQPFIDSGLSRAWFMAEIARLAG